MILFKAFQLSNYLKVTGEVSHVVEQDPFIEWPVFIGKVRYPVIRFFLNEREYYTAKRGELMFLKYEFLFKGYKRGDKVDLLVNEANPEEIFIDSITGYWFPIYFIYLAILLSFIWAGVVIIWTHS